MSDAIKTIDEVASGLLDLAQHIEKYTFAFTRKREDKARIKMYRLFHAELSKAVSDLKRNENGLINQIRELRAQNEHLQHRLDDVVAAPKIHKKPRIPFYRSPGGGIKGWLPTEEVKLNSPAYKQLLEIHQLNLEWYHHA